MDREHSLLCIINKANIENLYNYDEANLPIEIYDTDKFYLEGISYRGIINAEESVLYLLYKASKKIKDVDSGKEIFKGEKRPIDRIVYLISKDCWVRDIKVNQISNEILSESTKNRFFQNAEHISTKQLFVASIFEFCNKNSIQIPKFEEIKYDPRHPANVVNILCRRFNSPELLDIDISGGNRISAIMLTLISQVMATKQLSSEIGTIIYCDFVSKSIIRQNNNFELTELSNAFSAFMNYGKANLLYEFFKNNKYTTSETMQLCESMNQFSNALTLCDVEVIESIVDNIYSNIDTLQSNFETLEIMYRNLGDVETRFRNSLKEGNVNYDEHKRNAEKYGFVINETCSDEKAFLSELEIARKEILVTRIEWVFSSLLDVLKDNFISKNINEDKAYLLLDIIEWCNDKYLILQALTIFRERFGEILFRLGFFKVKDEFRSLSGIEKKEIVNNLPVCCTPKSGAGIISDFKTVAYDMRGNSDLKFKYIDLFESSLDNYDMRQLIRLYLNLHRKRNCIIHVDQIAKNQKQEIFNIDIIRKDIHEIVDLIYAIIDKYEDKLSVSKNAVKNEFNIFEEKSTIKLSKIPAKDDSILKKDIENINNDVNVDECELNVSSEKVSFIKKIFSYIKKFHK